MTTTEKRVAAAAFLMYAAVTLAVTLRHEAWSDEADSWLLMRDGGVTTMLARTGYAGTPPLWYLLLAPLARAGLPYLAQQLLNLAMIWAATLLLLFRAPFGLPLKLVFTFSYFPAFEYGVLARPYALLWLLLAAIAATWRERNRAPLVTAGLVTLLAATTAHGLIIAFVFGALFVIEAIVERRLRGSVLAAAGVMLLAGLAIAMLLRTPADGPRVIRHLDPGTPEYAIANAFFPASDPRSTIVISVLVLAVITFAVAQVRPALILLAVAVPLLLTLYTIVWMGGQRHAGLILLVVLAALWMAERESRLQYAAAAEAVLAIALLFSVAVAGRELIADFGRPYSGSKEMAEFIRRSSIGRLPIAAHPIIQCDSVLVYLPHRQFFYAAQDRTGSFMTWDRSLDAAQLMSLESAVARARAHFGKSHWLLLTNSEWPQAGAAHLRLVFNNREQPYAKPAERYWLYASE